MVTTNNTIVNKDSDEWTGMVKSVKLHIDEANKDIRERVKEVEAKLETEIKKVVEIAKSHIGGEEE